ncbi:EF-hand calcium-binding domain-containing protein 7-like [Rhopilema esculentum]|uniref:EF-hand calcium-binding domain-containing protein 7-like n=1 Tax=Rhopilema esculentum TaxID=499914 RepID=UPI0031D04C48|eukprot:gene4475-20718_t
MLRRSSTNSSTSSRLSREEDRVSLRKSKSGRSDSQKKSTYLDGSQKFGKSFSQRKPIYDEEKASFYENCKSIYLMVFDDIKDEITSPEELTLLLQYAGQNPTKKTVSSIWGGNTDSITFYQFCEILKDDKPMTKQALIKAFRKIDINGDGFITHEELQKVLTMHGERMTKSEVKAMMEDADYNGDGKLDYHEFCDMMLATANKVSGLQNSKQRKEESKKGTKKEGRSIKSRKEALSEEDGRIVDAKRPPSARKTSKRPSSRLQSVEKSSEASRPKMIKEPSDLTKWRYKNIKGSFYMEEDGTVESHQFRLLVLESTEIFITIHALTPKYGKFRNELVESDITMFLMGDGKHGKLVSFTETKIDQKFCLRANVEAGSYQLLTFTSGVSMCQDQENPATPSKLLIGDEDNAKFTKACRETLYEIFYRCDMDGNGFLNREEFTQFQLKTSGEGCDDDAWDIVKENFEMNNKGELTPEGFLKLNMMEAKDPDGGVDELWVTLESMGYNKGLDLIKAFPFQIDVFTRKGDSALEVIGISNGGKPAENCLISSIRASENQRPFDENKNVWLFLCQNATRSTIAVENKTNVPVKVRLRCNQSRNAQSKQESLDYVCSVDPKELQVVDHLIPKKKSQEVKVVCEEYIL